MVDKTKREGDFRARVYCCKGDSAVKREHNIKAGGSCTGRYREDRSRRGAFPGAHQRWPLDFFSCLHGCRSISFKLVVGYAPSETNAVKMKK